MSSLQHILSADPEPDPTPPAPVPAPITAHAMPPPPTLLSSQPPREEQEAAESTNGDTGTDPQASTDDHVYTSTTTSTRRNASGSVSSVYSGNKIRHLKKEDGIPLWRKDIQYEFLKLVFYDTTRCFTKQSDNTTGWTFAEAYVDAMAKSSKCSKILKEKLLMDTEGAISMAMVCLLVNVGRMNTTLNFFPEMRAQLRTYHSIPALQAHQDPNAYKQLQDAPRLKSILKGATEDDPQPSTLDEVKLASKPRTNPVNLIFVLSQFAPKISETHFTPPRDFYDLVMRSSLSSASRARAFLWLVWWYLESDFNLADTQRNPFGPGQYGEGEEGTGVLPLKVPNLESLTEEQAALENVDSEEEQHFGEVKRKERIAILASEPSPAMTALKRARKEKGLGGGASGYRSEDEGSEAGWWKNGAETKSVTSAAKHAVSFENDSSHTRTPSPAASRGFNAVNTTSAKPPSDMRINTLLNNDEAPSEPSPPPPPAAAPAPVKKGPGRGNWRRNKKADGDTPVRSVSGENTHPVPLLPNTPFGFVHETPEGAHGPPITPYPQFTGGPQSSPARNGAITFQPPSTRDHVPTPSYQAQKRNRGVTQHQSALINHRRQQIEYTLDRRIRKFHIRARDAREQEGSIFRAWKRIRLMPSDYDSEEEAIKIRKARERVDKEDDWRRAKEKDAHNGADEVDFRRPRALLAGFVRVEGDAHDVGEEVKAMARTLRLCSRRLDRWQGDSMPGQALLNSRRRQADGMFSLQRRKRSRREPSFDQDGQEIFDDERPPTATKRGQRQRNSGGQAITGMDGMASRQLDDGRAEEEDAGDELDDENRDLLGQLDADDSSDDDMEDNPHYYVEQ